MLTNFKEITVSGEMLLKQLHRVNPVDFQIDPDDYALWNGKSVVLENMGEIEESKKAYNESVKRGYDPTVNHLESINAPNPILNTISPDVLSGGYEG